MAMRMRAWLVACTTLAILLIPIAVAGTALATGERRSDAILAESRAVAHSETLASADADTARASVARQAYDLLLDNFVAPPPPSVLLTTTAAETRRRLSDLWPGDLPSLTLSAGASREEAWTIFEHWLDRVSLLSPALDRQTLHELAVRSMAASMSEHHTRYLDPRQNDEHQAWRRGEVRYEGIGARLRRPSTVVLEVFEGSPAARAGVRPGDRIVAVNGESVVGATSEVVIGKIRGPLGSAVELVVERLGSATPVHMSIAREVIKMPFVRWSVLEREPGRRIGYLQIRGFPEPSVDDRVAQALAEIDGQGIDGLILDLRGNSGGRIDVGMKVASRFVRDGVVYQQVDRSGRQRQGRPTEGTYWASSVPIVVLVDGGTASMGEILGSALQETGTARIVGMVTAGSVAGARMFPLSNGGALQITVLTITSGNGAVLNDVGVQPDEAVDLSDVDLRGGIDAQLEAGIRALGIAPRRASVPYYQPVTYRQDFREAA